MLLFFTTFTQIHANCRIRRVYFSDRLYSEDELPAEFKLYLPLVTKKVCNATITNYLIVTSFFKEPAATATTADTSSTMS